MAAAKNAFFNAFPSPVSYPVISTICVREMAGLSTPSCAVVKNLAFTLTTGGRSRIHIALLAVCFSPLYRHEDADARTKNTGAHVTRRFHFPSSAYFAEMEMMAGTGRNQPPVPGARPARASIQNGLEPVAQRTPATNRTGSRRRDAVINGGKSHCLWRRCAARKSTGWIGNPALYRELLPLFAAWKVGGGRIAILPMKTETTGRNGKTGTQTRRRDLLVDDKHCLVLRQRISTTM